MARRRWFYGLLLGLAGVLILLVPLPSRAPARAQRTFSVKADQFAYFPPVLHVARGDTVVLELESVDVGHGLYIDGYDVSVAAAPGRIASLTFTADRPGSYRFRCNIPCGALHPFMVGKIQVGQNNWFWRSFALVILIAFSGLVLPSMPQKEVRPRRAALTRSPLVKFLLKNRWPQLAVRLLLLGGFVFAILTGLIGTHIGNRNFGVVFVWIVWWAVLLLVAVPFFGRGWCAVCPLPIPGEWLQNGAIMRPPARRPRWLNLRWPKLLRNMWFQNVIFTLLALFSSIILTSPRVTAIVLAGMFVLATGMSFVFSRRAFCRYLCPVGGFIGLYAQVAPLELRVRDKQICLACKDKACYNGSVSGYGCPWDVFPGGLMKNTYCGLCLECLRACPYENIVVNARPFSTDLAMPSARLDEAFKTFIMLGSAMVYAAILLGPWGVLKNASYDVGSTAWFLYAVVFLAIIFVILPGIFTVGILSTRSALPLKQRFASLSVALIPLGLMFWVAFSLSFVVSNASYVLLALSDPFGWGWNLFGTATIAWQPYLTTWLPGIQTFVLVGGLLWTTSLARKFASELNLSPLAVIVFATMTTIGMLGLLL